MHWNPGFNLTAQLTKQTQDNVTLRKLKTIQTIQLGVLPQPLHGDNKHRQ